MRFADEVVSHQDIDEVPDRRSKPDAKSLKLATQIVDSLASDWKPEQYEDTYAEELRRLIKAKGEGKEVVAEVAPAERSNVVDLMAALEASVEAAKSGKGRKGVTKALRDAADELADSAEDDGATPPHKKAKKRTTKGSTAKAKATSERRSTKRSA
jgi:Uncharacterized conserved protein